MKENLNAFYSFSRKCKVKFSHFLIYQYFAHYICIQAKQDHLSSAHHIPNALRESFKESQNYFQPFSSNHFPMGQSLFMLLHKKFFFYPDIKTELSENYQSIIKFLGYWMAGDEKLFKFQGVSGWQRMKHDSIDLWTYELCGRLPGGLEFLIYTYSHSVSAAMGDSIPIAEVMKKWGSIISDLKAIAHNTLLVSDSYYLDQTE
jgi:hypothetical protein